eukprot:scaffold120337_cov68-Cyclotella_meneghiniana.AAC.1
MRATSPTLEGPMLNLGATVMERSYLSAYCHRILNQELLPGAAAAVPFPRLSQTANGVVTPKCPSPVSLYTNV